MLPMRDPTPAVSFLTTVRPNGHRQNLAMRSAANPNGIVMIRMNASSAANVYRIASQRPPKINQMMLRMSAH